jgi:hypothetical protein
MAQNDFGRKQLSCEIFIFFLLDISGAKSLNPFMAQKTSFQKNSFGGGFGINRSVGGAETLGVAEPPMRNTSVRPGSGFSRSDVGHKMKGSHFSGAKIIGSKKK